MGLVLRTANNVKGPALAGGPSAPVGVPDDTLTKVIKLIPAEAVSFYGAALGVVASGDNQDLWVLSVFVIGLAITVGALEYSKRVLDKISPPWWQAPFRIFAFVVWAMSISQPFKHWIAIDPRGPSIGVLILAVAAWVIPTDKTN